MDVIGRSSSHLGMDAARVVSNHAAERAMVVRCRIGSERQIVLSGLFSQGVEYATGLNCGEFVLGIDLEHVVHVLRCVKHHILARDYNPNRDSSIL